MGMSLTARRSGLLLALVALAAVLLAACDDPAVRERTTASRERHAQLGLVGVPSFVFEERIYWGNERLEWLLRDVCEQSGRPVPSLEDHVFGLPCPEPDGA